MKKPPPGGFFMGGQQEGCCKENSCQRLLDRRWQLFLLLVELLLDYLEAAGAADCAAS
jgi:hypothetical protein